eukprot:c12691_g1_i2 orf=570-800(+)
MAFALHHIQNNSTLSQLAMLGISCDWYISRDNIKRRSSSSTKCIYAANHLPALVSLLTLGLSHGLRIASHSKQFNA